MALNVARSTSCPGVAPLQQASNAVHGLKTSLISTRGDFLKGSPFNPLAGSSTRTRKVTNPAKKVSAKAKESYYIVQKGDSLYRIAKEHEVTLSSLANANSIKIARRVPILPGQRLKIPAVKDRAILNKQEKRRMQEKLKRIAEGPHLSSSREQLRASLIPKVPAQSDPAKATSSNRSSNLVASVAVDTRPVPQSRRPAAGWFSFWQPASILLLIGAALFYFIKLKPAAKTVDPNLRKAQAVKSSRLKLKPAPPLPSPLQSSTLQSSPPKSSTIVVEAAVDTAEGSGEWVNTPESKLRFTRVGSTLFSVGSPRVLESLLSSSAQLPRVVTRTSLAPSQYAAERLEARKVLEERLAAARAQLLETHRRAEIAKAKAQQALEASEAAWITVERFRELSSADKKVLWTAEEALERLTLEKELATGLDRKR